MRLSELLKYEKIVIQCHDNPDADAICSGYGLYCFFKERGKEVRFVYSGKFQIQKSNLVLLIQELEIPIEYVENLETPDLLLLVDCQYKEGNVTRFEGKKVAVIDHHEMKRRQPRLREIRGNLASASTLVWHLLEKEFFDVKNKEKVSTALYYGLYTDSNAFAEVSHPLDRDLRDQLPFDHHLMKRLKNSNLSLEELKIAGVAMLGYEYYENHRYAILQAAPCDPNILGLISDFCLAVDTVEICLVYSILPNGVKFSVRSCSRESRANELAEYLAAKIGTGGGREDKAGGFADLELLEKHYHRFQHASEADRVHILKDIFRKRMGQYFESYDVIDTSKEEISLEEFGLYERKEMVKGYVAAKNLPFINSKIVIRTLYGDSEICLREKDYLMIDLDGKVFPLKEDRFLAEYEPLEQKYDQLFEYEPTARNDVTGEIFPLLSLAKCCKGKKNTYLYAKKLRRITKVFTLWDEENYLYGKVGDYLLMRSDNKKDLFIADQKVFLESYIAFTEDRKNCGKSKNL